MSVASWAIIAVKGLTLVLRNGRSRELPELLLERDLARGGGRRDRDARRARSVLAPDRHAMQAQAHHARYGAAKLEEAGTSSDFVTRTIKKVLDEETIAARERPDAAGDGRRDRALRRPLRHRLGRLPRAGRDRHERRRHARQGRRPGRRGADHDRPRPGGRDSGGDGLQLADARQPRADGQARRLRLRAAHLRLDGPAAGHRRRRRRPGERAADRRRAPAAA